ncbi:MAG: hypothetical protein GY930_20175 [bacterium]|nr:hypothetical protein [bacterium]
MGFRICCSHQARVGPFPFECGGTEGECLAIGGDGLLGTAALFVVQTRVEPGFADEVSRRRCPHCARARTWRGATLIAGLSDLRVSPVHGTAFDIAGKGIADETNLAAALGMAVD